MPYCHFFKVTNQEEGVSAQYDDRLFAKKVCTDGLVPVLSVSCTITLLLGTGGHLDKVFPPRSIGLLKRLSIR